MTDPQRLSQGDQRRLLARLRARDETALGELYDALAPWVVGLAFRILQDDDEAEEVLGDVFLQIWTRIEQHDPRRGPLVPWILRISRNRSLDLVRRRQRWWARADRAGMNRLLEAEEAPEPGEAGVPGWPVHREVHAALAALPEEQRTVVQHAYFGGLSHSEIARRTGMPLGTVKTRLRLGQQRLEQLLAHVKDWWE